MYYVGAAPLHTEEGSREPRDSRYGVIVIDNSVSSLIPIRSCPWQKTVWPTESVFLAVELDFRINNQISVLCDTQVRK